MDIYKKNYGCIDCGNSGPKCEPCGGCGPAAYECGFNIAAVPFDPTSWNVTWCGKTHRVKLPPIPETDTKHSLNYSNATFNYTAEEHEESWTGAQIGSIITVGDLRDTKVDYDTSSLCYELIYHKYGSCGEGCMSVEDSWSTFSIDNDGALGPQIRYVRGANRYGCPYFLDVPTNSSQYWYQGWRGDANENGYYQAAKVGWLPKDSNGNFIALSQYNQNKQPIVGVIPWDCMWENVFANLGVSVAGDWRPVQGTAGFGAWFNQIDGNFRVYWDDWNDLAETQHAGHGEVTGKLNWTIKFNPDNGTMTYVINNIYFDTMTWTVDQGVTASSNPKLNLYAIQSPSGAQVNLIPGGVVFGSSTVTRVINQTVTCDRTVTIAPGGPSFNLDFLYIYVDWVNDDEGYLGAKFSSLLSGWKSCAPGTGY